ncbi:peptidoglycan-binding protein [Streptomyces sp. NPDC048441]|uniref:peptidoglycan-binding domain-containing protein n=1 Tax=Streptomyces sp. NPDC048441 TaxID=3365552 RepID=UPI0037249BC9
MGGEERREDGATGGAKDGSEGGAKDGSEGGRGGQLCPECGTSRDAGSAPACGCTERAADAARDARSADAAAAEDFDPLRIRPYVTLPEPGPPAGEAMEAVEAVAVVAAAGTGAEESAAVSPSAPVAPALPPPPPAPPHSYDDEPEPRRGRRGRIGLYAGVSAVAVVAVAVVVLAAVLLAPDKPQRDQSLPDVPTRVVHTPSDTDTGSESATASRSPSAAHKASPPPSPSLSRTVSAKPGPTPSPIRSTARATGSVESASPSIGGVLSQGDRGPEVTELQQRLQQLYLYVDEADGIYDTPVADAVARYQYARGTQRDGEGVYGEETRAALEAETSEPR